MAFYHLWLAGQAAPEFVLPKRGAQYESMGIHIDVEVKGMEIDHPVREFAAAYNKYIRAQNAASRGQNLISFWGYITASVTALISFYLTLPNSHEHHS